MEQIIHFFRDTLDGPVYIIVAIVAGVLLCACIGYLAEKSIKRKKAEKEGDSTAPSMETKITTEQPVEKESVSTTPPVTPTVGTIPEVNTQVASSVQQPVGQPVSSQGMSTETPQPQAVPAAPVIPTITIPTGDTTSNEPPSSTVSASPQPETISAPTQEAVAPQLEPSQTERTIVSTSTTPVETISESSNVSMPESVPAQPASIPAEDLMTVQQPVTSIPTPSDTGSTSIFEPAQTAEVETNGMGNSQKVESNSSIEDPFASTSAPQTSTMASVTPNVEQQETNTIPPVEPVSQETSTVIPTIDGLSQGTEKTPVATQDISQQ